ncbi:hypothetical protein I4F81_003200 [Pyropia yezoensis]|uniref:Uncharacterized protein n=1 Tax=Pyropia yezoensis TaxID=2788 RepID=A0ACC3BRT6_PYRYE|nr:hypothetical protein I4F81_003200 [Neopyropia yezoensis]
MSLLLVDIGGGDCRTSELLSALTAGASMPSTLRLGTNYAEEGDAALDDRCLQELAAGPSASDALQELAVELDEAVTVAGLRALGGLPALRRLTLTCGAFPSAAFHPWAVTQLAHLTVECGSASGAEVITALAAARVPRLSSLTLRASVPLPRLVEPALASLRLRRFRSLWCWTRLREDVARPSFPTDPAWLAVNEWALADAQAEIAAVDPALVTAEVTAQLAELQQIVDDATANAATAAAEVVNAETALAEVQAAVDDAAALIVSLGGTVPTARMLQLSGRLGLSSATRQISPLALLQLSLQVAQLQAALAAAAAAAARTAANLIIAGLAILTTIRNLLAAASPAARFFF